MKAPTIRLQSRLSSNTYRRMSRNSPPRSGIEPSMGEVRTQIWQIDGFQSEIVIAQEGNIINISWVDGSSNEDLILIERSLDGIKFAGINVVSPNTTSYSDDVTGIEVEDIYYRITAIKGDTLNKSNVKKASLVNMVDALFITIDDVDYYLTQTIESEDFYLQLTV